MKIALTSAVVVLVLTLGAAVAVSVQVAMESSGGSDAAWKAHRRACQLLPESVYHQDRARAVRGLVFDSEGAPVPDALVQCIRLETVLERARVSPPSPDVWSNLVEEETRTDSQGRYEFSHLSEGCRTLCVSAPGRAPDVQSLIVTADGSGARVDFNLGKPTTLRVRLEDADDRPRRVHLVPHQWWPGLLACDLAAGETEATFDTVGGPFRKGLILVSDLGSLPQWELKGAFDLAQSNSISISCALGEGEVVLDVPEAEWGLAWRSRRSAAERLFFGLQSPVALFWQPDSTPAQPGAAASRQFSIPGFADIFAHVPRASSMLGGLRGYGPSPFLPILIEARDGDDAFLQWTSSAAEFELVGIPPGVYRVRSLNTFGRVSFARGLVVPPGGMADLKSSCGVPIELDEPHSREVMGCVRWEDGRPAEGATVYLQDAASFRRFLQHVETNPNGFFAVSGVPGNAHYVAFALPPNDEHAMKNFVYPRVGELPREMWLDLVLSPHRIVGRVPLGLRGRQVQLVRQEAGADRPVWAVTAKQGGEFEISNVPHGTYIVQVTDERGQLLSSLPCVVQKEVTVEIRWPASS